MMTRLLIIEEHEGVRRALAARLASADVQIVGSTGDHAEGLRQALDLRPDVILLELKGPNSRWLELIRQLSEARLMDRVIVLTSYPDDEERRLVLQAGARDYLLKDLDSKHLIQAIQEVHYLV
jgi:NarL family two-component system response regulator LiaR